MSENIQPHNEKAAAMWGGGGRSYDKVSRFIAEGIEHCVDRLAPKSGERVLDVATGTGWTSRRLAEHGARVTGIDIAEGMLTAAQKIAGEAGLDIDYRLADAEALPFDDGVFDAVISTCGVMFAGKRDAAASELARVCRKGGRLGLMTWTPDSTAADMRKVMLPYMPPPPSPPPPSPFDWGKPAWLTETLGGDFAFGFEEGVLHHRMPDGEAVWNLLEEGFGPVRAVSASLDRERRAELKADFVRWCEQFRSGLGVTVPYQYLVTLGTRR